MRRSCQGWAGDKNSQLSTEAPVMSLPRVRFTVRWMMAAVAVAAVVLSLGADQVRRSVTFEYVRVIPNEPLVNPTRAVAIDWDTLALSDGRTIRMVDGPMFEGHHGLKEEPGPKACVVDLGSDQGGAVTVHMLKPAWYCGNRSYKPLLRVPLYPRTVYRNYRKLIGYGRVVPAASATPGL